MIYSINKSEVISGLIEIKQVIESRLKQLSEDAAGNGSVNRTTIHTDAEKFFEDFLNELYGWQLKSANAEKQNAPGVDLIYEGEKVIVQVSNKSTKDKVVESLNKTSDEYKKGCLRFKLVTMQLKHTKYKDSSVAEFDKAKGGLDFDCHKDVIDVTSIIRDVNDATAEKVRALKKVVDAYFERAQARKDLGLKKLGSGKARNLFEFNSGSVGFFGRENEMERLRAFVSGDDPFRWYAIAAPGGAGKTRLAYELQNELEKSGWTCLEIKGENVWKQLGELDGLYPGKTLFIADYVAPHTGELGAWMKKLSQPEYKRDHPLRLLLLERDTRDENGRVAWFESLLSADRADIPLCGQDSPEALKPLGDEFLLKLIRGFSKTAVKAAREEGQECRPLEDGEERRIREKLDSIDKNLVRPFYAMLLTDAWVRDPEAPKWEQKDLLSYVVGRELDIIKKRIEGTGVPVTEQLVQAVCRIWMAATVLGAGSPVAADKLYEAFRPEFDLVKRSAERKAELLDSIELAPHESLLQAAGIFSDGSIIPILPDILGEFFVLTGVDEPVFRQRLWAAAMEELHTVYVDDSMAFAFFKRLLSDFGQMMAEDDGLRMRVFPEDPELDDEKTQLYARLLRLLFDEPNDRPVREAPKKTLVALADGRQGNTEENSVIWNDAGSVCQNMGEHERALGFLLKSVKASEKLYGKHNHGTATAYSNIATLYHAMGDYDKALKYGKKSIKVKVIDKNRPDIATTYNNVASLYQAIGDYDKAFKYYKKALANLEKLPDLKHPSEATTYNNIASLYQDKGDYDKALEFNLKALKVREKTLGAEHPDTAMTYNNIASLYQAMGDYDKALEFSFKTIAVFEKVLGAEHSLTATAYNNTASAYCAKGDLDNALEYYKKAYAVTEKVLGVEHPDTATKCNNLALQYIAMGDYDNARIFFNKAIGIVEKVLGTNYPDTAATYNNVALLYKAMGNYDNALEYNVNALKVREKVLGTDHPDTAATYNNIADLYLAMGDYDNALEFNLKALKVREKVLGVEHPDTTVTYNNVALAHQAMGNYDNALEYCFNSLNVLEKALGTEHHLTATVYNNIASVYEDMGDYDKALEYYEKALAVREKVLGKDHPDTAATYNNIAQVYQAMGNYDNALEYCFNSLNVLEKALGTEHHWTAMVYNNIASVYEDIGDYAGALEYYEKALAVEKKVLGKDHPLIATTYNNIASLYYDIDDYGRALEYNEKALTVREKVLGKDHPHTATTYNNIALAYQAVDNYGRALDYFKKALDILEKVLGKDHPRTATTYNNIALAYQAVDDYGRALEYSEIALTVREKVLGKDHPDTAASYNNIAGVYQDMGDLEKALEFNLKALKIREKVLGAEHPDTATAYNNIAGVYQDMGDYDKALEYYEKAIAVQEKVIGADHPDTAVAYVNIGALRFKQNNRAEAVKYLTKACDVFDKKLGPGHPNTKLAHQWLEAALKLPSD